MIRLNPYTTFLSAILFALLAGCGGSPTTVASAPTPTPLPTATNAPAPASAPTATGVPKLTLQPCRLDDFAGQCGALSVFEDRAAQSGRKIDLRVAMIPAQTKHPAPDPIFWLAGGPGGAATEDVPYAMQVLGLANQQRDVVFVDQRGTGGSNKLVCPQPADPALQVEALRTCLTRLNGDPSAYTTAWGMDDVDDVRAALGYDQINLYGGSYGATAVQVYILRHGEHVRSAAVNGVSLLDVPMFERYPISSQKALELVFTRCEADATCHSAFPNVRQEFAGVLARMEQGPITLPVNDPLTGMPAVLTSEKFRTAVHSALVLTTTAVLLPRFIHLTYIQDWSGLAAFMAPFLNSNPETPQWKIMSLTILCHEDWAKTRRAETTAASAGSYLKYEDVRELTLPDDICAVMPRPTPEALYGPITGSSVPMLLISNEADPQDPPGNVAGAKERYPNSLSLIAPGQGHGFTGIPCHASIVADLIARGSVEDLQIGCLAQVALPAFAK